MTEIPKKYIQVNIPLTAQEYLNGNGEGVWVEVDEETRKAYDADATGAGFKGILANDSLYYPGLCCGIMIPFEMRGEHRPVVDYHGYLDGLPHLTELEKAALIQKIAEAQSGGDGV